MAPRSFPLPNESIQREYITYWLNLSLVGMFLTGLYTMVYFWTLHTCLTRDTSPRKFVIWVVSLLYACGMAECGIQWALLNSTFLKSGDTRQTVFKALLTIPQWLHVMNNIFAFTMIILADLLLIWRCFHVWNSSIRVVFLPLFLFLGEVCLFLSDVIILFVTKAQPTHRQALIVNRIGAAGYFVSAVISIAATFLIAYRINSVSKEGLSESRGRFKHIVEILVQSVLVYSLAQLVQTVAVIIPFSIGNARLYALTTYSGTILIPITGIAPTVMVARVNLAAGETDLWPGTRQATTLRFRSQDGTASQSDTRVLSDIEKSAIICVSRGEP